MTELHVLKVHKHDFLAFLRGTDLPEALVRLAKNRELPSWSLMDRNLVLRGMTIGQRTQLQALLEATELAKGDVLLGGGSDADAAWLLDSAEVELDEDGHGVTRLSSAALIGDI